MSKVENLEFSEFYWAQQIGIRVQDLEVIPPLPNLQVQLPPANLPAFPPAPPPVIHLFAQPFVVHNPVPNPVPSVVAFLNPILFPRNDPLLDTHSIQYPFSGQSSSGSSISSVKPRQEDQGYAQSDTISEPVISSFS